MKTFFSILYDIFYFIGLGRQKVGSKFSGNCHAYLNDWRCHEWKNSLLLKIYCIIICACGFIRLDNTNKSLKKFQMFCVL